jgi:hypothetical protein
MSFFHLFFDPYHSTFAAYTAAKCQALYQRRASERQAAFMYMDMAQLSLTSTNRKMSLPFCVHYKFQALFSHVHILGRYHLELCNFPAQQKMLQNFGSFPLFYCNAGMEVEGTTLKLVIVMYQTIKTNKMKFKLEVS